MSQYLSEYKNEETQMLAVVTKGANGFHVSLKDLDADAWVPINIICPTFEMADKKASKIL